MVKNKRVLKRLEIVDGKFMLEGKTVEVEPICLKVVEFEPAFIDPTETDKKQSRKLQKKILERQTLEEATETRREWDEEEKEEKRNELKKLRKAAPRKADAYVVSKNNHVEYRGAPFGFIGAEISEWYYAVLFVRIK